MNEPRDKVSAAYAALPREEPGPALDAAILAASRRALAPTFAARRWAGPVSIAAVLMLAVGVTLNMQRDQPGIETPAPDMYGAPPAADVAESSASAAVVPEPPKAVAPKAIAPPPAPQEKPAARKLARVQEPVPAAPPARDTRERDRAFRDEMAAAPSSDRKDLAAQAAPVAEAPLRKEPKLAAAPPMAPPAPAAFGAAAAPEAAAKRDANETRATMQSRMKVESAAAPARAAAAAAADAQAPADEITRSLEAIAKLRAEGRHEDADKALEAFRRKHPGHRIDDAMWERVRAR